jgi:hypothetical protein
MLFQFGFPRSDFLVQQEAGFSRIELAEAEYMAANTASCEAIWLHKLIAELIGECWSLHD